MQVASQAQSTAKSVQQEKMAVAFQTVAMGVTVAAQRIRNLPQSQTPRQEAPAQWSEKGEIA
jgi:hypothetical protein